MVGSRNGHGAQKSEINRKASPIARVLAIAPHGRDVNTLLARGFQLETMADLVRRELATVRIEIVENHDSKIEFALLQITDAGWRALEGLTTRRRSPRPANGR